MAGSMKLREWRVGKGYAQGETGALIGVSGVTVSRYETGGRIPEHDVMVQIATVTNGAVTPNDFYDLPSPPMPAAREREIA